MLGKKHGKPGHANKYLYFQILAKTKTWTEPGQNLDRTWTEPKTVDQIAVSSRQKGLSLMPTVEQRLDRLRRRRDFLALRIPQQTVEPHYDKSEHAALNWVIRFVEEHYVPESPQMERNPLAPCRAGSRDFQESSKVEAPKAPKAPRLIPTVPHGTAS